MKLQLFAVLTAVAVASAACGKKADVVEEPAAPTGADAWFQYIPSDTPFLMANLKPMPEDFVSWLSEGFAPMAGMLQQRITEEMADADEQQRAVLAELDGKMSREGMASVGVSFTPRYAIYGIGMSLAMRLELADGALMRDFIARIEAAAGEKAPRATFEDIEYLTMTEDQVTLALAIHGDELIFGLMPENTAEQVLPVLFGKVKPERSLADNNTLRQIVDENGFQGVASGYFDTTALVRMLTGRASARSKAIIALSGADIPEFSPTCQQEFDDLAAAAPRMVFGYTELARGAFSARAVLEMRSDLAAEMAGLQKPVYGLGDAKQSMPLFAMGVGLDLPAAIEWLKGKAQSIADAPYQCEHLGEFNDAMTEIAREMGSMQASVPPFLLGFDGFTAALTSLDNSAGPTPSGTGYAMVGVENPMQIIGMAQGFVPQLAGVQIQPGAPPVAFATGMPSPAEAHITVQGEWIGLAAGEAEAKALVGRMKQKPAQDGPFMVLGYNYKQLMDTMGQMGGMANEGPAEQELMRAVGSMLGYTELEMRFEARGLVMDQHVRSLP
ncbi:MAG: hypothetical protein Tsb0020_46980 [Haliangiales bacterium]